MHGCIGALVDRGKGPNLEVLANIFQGHRPQAKSHRQRLHTPRARGSDPIKDSSSKCWTKDLSPAVPRWKSQQLAQQPLPFQLSSLGFPKGGCPRCVGTASGQPHQPRGLQDATAEAKALHSHWAHGIAARHSTRPGRTLLCFLGGDSPVSCLEGPWARTRSLLAKCCFHSPY